jgi:hypothetical protein
MSEVESQDLFDRVEGKIVLASEMRDPTRFLFYGRSGAGKTRLAATAPRVLLVDINERGTKSVRRDHNPNVFPVSLWSEVQDIYWYLESGNHEFDSVAVDGVTSLQNLCIKFVLGDEIARDASRDPDMPTRQVWGKVGELMKTTITNFRNLEMNIIFTALQRTRFQGEEDEISDSVISPACSPSVGGHLEAAVDVIGHLSKKEVRVRKKGEEKIHKVVRSRLLVGPSEHYITKDRTGLFGQYIQSPSVDKMIDTIYKEEE